MENPPPGLPGGGVGLPSLTPGAHFPGNGLRVTDLRTILRFGWPYLRRYKARFLAGILLGLVFSATHGVILQVTNVVMQRLDPEPPKAAVVARATPEGVSVAGPAGGVWDGVRRQVTSLREAGDRLLDPWLPRSGRPMTTREVVGVLLLFPLLMAARGYTGYLSSYCLGWVSERVINDLQVDVLRKLHTLSLDYFNRSTMGDLSARVQTDTAWLHRTLSLGLSDLVKEPATVLFLFLVLLVNDWQITLFLTLVLPLCMAPIVLLGRKIRKAAEGGVATKVSQTSLLFEVLSGIRVVKAFNLEGRQTERFSDHARDLVRYGMKGVQAKELVNPILETLIALVTGILVVLLFRSGHSTREMLAFPLGLGLAITPLKKIAGLHVLFEQSSAGVRRLGEILEERPTVREPEHPVKPAPFSRGISFDAVSFAYADRPVLQELRLEIPRGQRVGVAGESGSGKSTLLNLLFRFYDPTHGRILLDGVDHRSMSMSDLRMQMALVSQEIVLFDQTVAENIACGRLGASRAEIESAARAAFAHEFIAALPHGYDTRIGERGVTLSGGQRQRLAIARAFVRNAPILVLDEATASLDSQSESEVQASIDALAEKRTVICVAHRLSTLANMDRILVLEKGRIVEDGPFDLLLRSNGLFAAMARKQGL